MANTIGNGTKHPHIILKAKKVSPPMSAMQQQPDIKTSGITPDDVLQMIATGFEQAAAAMFQHYIRQIQLEKETFVDGFSEAKARKVAQENVGYESVKYSYVIAERAQVLMGAYHPVFGLVEERKDMLDMTALQAGYLLGRLTKAGYRLEETLLYYPNRKPQNVTLETVLKNPEYDPILGPLSIITAEEQRVLDEKSDAFFKNLGV